MIHFAPPNHRSTNYSIRQFSAHMLGNSNIKCLKINRPLVGKVSAPHIFLPPLHLIIHLLIFLFVHLFTYLFVFFFISIIIFESVCFPLFISPLFLNVKLAIESLWCGKGRHPGVVHLMARGPLLAPGPQPAPPAAGLLRPHPATEVPEGRPGPPYSLLMDPATAPPSSFVGLHLPPCHYSLLLYPKKHSPHYQLNFLVSK